MIPRENVGVVGRDKKKKNFNLPRSLQCCNCWVCAGVSLLLNVPQLQGRHQVVEFAAAFVWRDDETRCGSDEKRAHGQMKDG